MRPETILRGNVSVRAPAGTDFATAAAGIGTGPGVRASGSMAVASRPSERTIASDSSCVSGTARPPAGTGPSRVRAAAPPGVSHS